MRGGKVRMGLKRWINADRQARRSSAGCALRVLSCAAAALALCLSLTGLQARAQSAAQDATGRALLERTMVRPDDLDAAFEYAAHAIRIGDLEAAISTLERMLIFAPGQPRLQYELGVLYFRIGAYGNARGYFSEVARSDNLPDHIRRRVARYLEEVETRTATRSVEGTLRLGARYQSNADAITQDRLVGINGLDFLLGPDSVGGADTNGFASADIVLKHDLASQGDRLEARLSVLGELYADRDELDLGYAEIQAGPVFNLERFRLRNTELGIYAIAGGMLLGGEEYLGLGGAGVSVSAVPGSGWRTYARGEYRREEFQATEERPRANRLTGNRFRGVAGLRRTITNSFALFGQMEASRRDTGYGYLSHTQLAVMAGGVVTFDSPLPAQEQQWALTLTTGYVNRRYDDPDPTIDLRQRRLDEEAFVQAALSVPVGDDWAVEAGVGYRDVASSHDLQDYSNFNASLALLHRF